MIRKIIIRKLMRYLPKILKELQEQGKIGFYRVVNLVKDEKIYIRIADEEDEDIRELIKDE